MRSPLRWAILFIVLFVVSSIAAVLLVLWSLSGASVWGRGEVLAIKISGEVPELASRAPFTQLLNPGQVDLRDILDGIERASGDSRIKGLYLELNDPALGWAQNEEVRAAIARFRAQGKWAWSYMETAGEFAGGNAAYLLASTCDKVFIAPPGDVGLTGLYSETPFLRGMLDKLGVVPQFGQRKEFKNAANTFMERDFTPAHREATLRLLESLYEDMVVAVATNRKLTEPRVRELISAGPHTGPEALRLGLIDELLYHDEVLDRIEDKTGQEKPLVKLANYLKSGRPHDSGSRTIAVIYAIGGVQRGKSGQNPLTGDAMGSDTVSRALRKAREDDDVAAVVLRVDSPGGSYVASDVIRREVELTKKEKPVVASMGNVAASGGYFVSMQASRIVADSGTITGSIGVLGGKMVTKGLWDDKLGIHFGTLQQGDNAHFWSSQTEYDAKGWERMNAWLDRIYEDFTTKAAQGRGLPLTQLEPLAHGRVWSGKDALERKLIDEIGGLREAVEAARKAAKLEDDARFRILVLPEPPGLLASLRGQDASLADAPQVRELMRAIALLSPPSEETLLLDPGIPRIR